MTDALAVLTPIALLDSTSMLPVAIVVMAVLLGGRQPYRGSLGFISGIFFPYFGFGVAAALGLDFLMEGLNTWFERFYAQPTTLELGIQAVLGLAAIWFGARLLRSPAQTADAEPQAALGPAEAFAVGAGTILVGLPGAVPYFVAIDQVLRADLSIAESVTALAVYCLIVVAPLLAMMLLRMAMGESSAALFARIAEFTARWAPRVFAVLLLVLGVVFTADGIGFLFGYPLLPVG